MSRALAQVAVGFEEKKLAEAQGVQRAVCRTNMFQRQEVKKVEDLNGWCTQYSGLCKGEETDKGADRG
jgi:hypothetical protein